MPAGPLGHTGAMTTSRRAAVMCAAMVLLGPVALQATASEPSSTDGQPGQQVLLYGFEPFGPFEVNPTAALVRRLALAHPERRAAILSVQPADAVGELYHLMSAAPRVILGFGVRADLQDLEVNTAATNWMSMRSEAAIPFFGAIDPGLPVAIALPDAWHQTIRRRLRDTGVAHTLSADAGMHACNLTFFQALVHAEPATRVVFIHVAPDAMTRPGYFEALGRVVDALLLP